MTVASHKLANSNSKGLVRQTELSYKKAGLAQLCTLKVT